MDKSHALVFLLALVGLVSAPFFIEDYFYPDENAGMVTYDTFTYNGAVYKLARISGNDSFIIDSVGNAVEDEAKLSAITTSYYKSKYAPNSEDVDEVRTYLKEYNDSRNDGNESVAYKLKGKEELECRNALLMSGKISYYGKPLTCVDDATCNITAKVFYYSDYKPGEPVRMTMKFSDAFTHIKTFGIASYKLDALLSNDIGSLNAATDDTLYDSLVTIKNSIPELKQAEQTVETTKFRYPKDKTDSDQCKKDQCLAICPPLSLYDGALSQLEIKIDYILSSSAPFFNHKNLAASLANSTKNRFFYKESEQKSAYYKAVLAPIKLNITKIISESEKVASHVNNGTFKSKLESLKSLDNQINYSITSHNFSNIDTSISEYKLLAVELENLSESVFKVYERSYDAKQQTAALLFSIESKDLNQDLSKRVLELKEATYSLDTQFDEGLTPEQYSYFEESYYGISNEVLSIIQNQKEFVALSKFRGLARKINNGVSDLIESSNVIPSAQVSQLSKRLPLAFSIFSFISLTSIVLLIGLSHLSNSKNKASLLFFSLGLIAFIGGILLFSAGLYFYLDKTSNSADVGEFIMTMNGEKSVSIVMDLEDVPLEAARNIKSCASLLNESLVTSEQNRSVTVYQLDGTGCKISGGTADDNESCAPPLGQPTFILKYSPDLVKPTFSAVFDKKAYISGDESYYKYCAISSVFR